MSAASDGDATAPTPCASAMTRESGRNRDHSRSNVSITSATAARVASASGVVVSICQTVPMASNRHSEDGGASVGAATTSR